MAMSKNTKTSPRVEDKRESTIPKLENKWFQKIFLGSLVLMLAILWIGGYDSGFGSDEMDMNIYGKANIAYYSSGFKDTSFLHPDHKDGVVLPTTLPYYGSGFEYFATGLTSIVQDEYEYNTRHALNQFIAILALLFTGLIAAKISDYKTAIISIWLLFLTPIFSGLAIFDTKDIPFLSAYIASIYFAILFFKQLAKPSVKTLIGLAFSLWFLLSIRIGGILMLGFIGLYAFLEYRKNKEAQQNLKTWLPRLLGSMIIAFVFMILLWPFVLQNPIENIIKTLNVVKDFPQKILVAFDGEYLDSLSLPKNYLPKMMSVSIPIAITITLIIGFVSVCFNWKKITHKNEMILLLVSGLAPAVYAVYSNMPLYNSWRHLLFIYPSIVLFCTIGFGIFLQNIQKPMLQMSVIALLLIGLAKPIIWCVQNNPYQYTYYNELADGYERAYYDFDTDYWQITTKEAIDWLMKNENMESFKDTQIIATNAFTFSNYYLKKRYPKAKVKCEMLGEKSSFGAQGTYRIFNNLFLEPQYLENCFPSPFSIHTVNIGGMPTTYVAKDSANYTYKAYLAFQSADFKAADSLYNLYLAQIKYDGGAKNLTPLMGIIAYTKYATDQYEEALELAQKTLVPYPSDYMTNLTLGAVYIAAREYKKAMYYLRVAQEIKPNESAPQAYMDVIPK
jgi:tetratricopeptide (TPR) repeat protein